MVEVTKRHLEDPKIRELAYIYLLEKVTETLKKTVLEEKRGKTK